MKRVLIAKEWAGMRPFVWLLVLLGGVDLLAIAADGLYDLHRRNTLYADYQWTTEAVATLVLAFAAGTGLLAREVEEGTLSFLDGLPVRRRDVFLAKLAVAGGCLLAYAALDPALGWGLHVLLRHSVDVPVPAATLAVVIARYALLVAAGLALGVLFGFVRNLSWALFAIAAAAVAVLRSAWPSAAAAIDPTALLAEGWSVQGLGGDGPWVVLALTLACFGAAYAAFAYAGGTVMLRLSRLAEQRRFVLAMYAGAAIALTVIAVQAARNDRRTDDVADGPAAGTTTAAQSERNDERTDGRARKVVTQHYTFNVPAGTRVDERTLRAADSAFVTATKALAIDVPEMASIDVDLGGSIEHTDGLASHNRIRLNVHPGWENALVHETVHVLGDTIGGASRGAEMAALTLFNEGLAHWAEPERRASRERRDAEDLAVATIYRRGLLRQGTLLDRQALESDLDWEMKYPLGAKLIEALTARYGKHAPVAVLVTLSRPDFPRDLRGYELYRTAFQLAGYDLNLVMNDYALELQRLSDRYAAVIDAMPRPRGLLVRDSGRTGIAVQVDRQGTYPSGFVVRLRARDDARMNENVVVSHLDLVDGRLVAWVPPSQVANDRVCYQIGVPGSFGTMYEPWSCLPLRAGMALSAPASAAPPSPAPRER